MTFTEFKNQYNGQSNVGNTAANRGQCVGLVSLWMDNFNIAHVWGDAKDLYANASDKDFAKIPNDPTAIPQQGDIIIWSGAFNGGVGHTGIASGKADVNTFECFEQNDPIGSNPHLKTYNYAYVVGWLRPKQAVTDAVSVPKATFEQLVTKSGQRDNIADKYSFDKSGNIDKLVFEKITELEKTKQQIQTALDSCKPSLNQAATIPPADIPTSSVDALGNSIPPNITGGGISGTIGGTIAPTSVGNFDGGNSPQVVPQEAQGVEFLAPFFYNIVNFFKNLFKRG